MTKDKNDKRNLRRKAERPEEIVDSAMKLWATRGFAATKIEQIAKGAGVAKGTVYLYFESKEAIFEAAVKLRLVSTMDQVDEMTKGDSFTTHELLKNFYHAVYAELFVKGSATLMKVLIAEGHRFPGLAQTYQKIALVKGIHTIKGILQRGVQRGELGPAANSLDSRLVMAPVVMYATMGMVFGKYSETEFFQLVESHMDLLMKGLQEI